MLVQLHYLYTKNVEKTMTARLSGFYSVFERKNRQLGDPRWRDAKAQAADLMRLIL